jgi:hypothetical protein
MIGSPPSSSFDRNLYKNEERYWCMAPSKGHSKSQPANHTPVLARGKAPTYLNEKVDPAGQGKMGSSSSPTAMLISSRSSLNDLKI